MLSQLWILQSFKIRRTHDHSGFPTSMLLQVWRPDQKNGMERKLHATPICFWHFSKPFHKIVRKQGMVPSVLLQPCARAIDSSGVTVTLLSSTFKAVQQQIMPTQAHLHPACFENTA
jgi:hypothetical protein